MAKWCVRGARTRTKRVFGKREREFVGGVARFFTLADCRRRSKEGSLTDGISGAEERERDDEGRIEDQVRVGAGGGIRTLTVGAGAQTQGIVLRLDFP